MIRILAAFIALVATPVFAQQTVPLVTEPLPGQVIQQPAAQAQPGLVGTYGDWEVRCVSDTECVMTQLHRRTEQTADVVFTVVKPKSMSSSTGQPVEAYAEIMVPLGVYLPGGLGLKVDQQAAKAAPFERCIRGGCIVRAPISAEMLASLKSGNTASVVIFGGPQKPVQVPFSLRGFTAGFGAL